MENKEKEKKLNRSVLSDTYEKEYDYLANSATGMDCTGLMYRPADNAEEAESYRQVYDYLPPTVSLSDQKPEEEVKARKTQG